MDQLACKNDIIGQFAAAKVDDDDSDAKETLVFEIIFQKNEKYILISRPNSHAKTFPCLQSFHVQKE